MNSGMKVIVTEIVGITAVKIQGGTHTLITEGEDLGLVLVPIRIATEIEAEIEIVNSGMEVIVTEIVEITAVKVQGDSHSHHRRGRSRSRTRSQSYSPGGSGICGGGGPHYDGAPEFTGGSKGKIRLYQ